MFLKKGPYHVVKHTDKRLRCNVSLVKLLDKFTRIMPHVTAQNTSFLIQSSSEEVSRNWTVSTDFQACGPKICRNCVHGNFSTKKLDDKAHISHNVGNLYILRESLYSTIFYQSSSTSLENWHLFTLQHLAINSDRL